ncbi:adenine-specific DNA-methyltransferase [Deltaproteobacteria bacterium TL4]
MQKYASENETIYFGNALDVLEHHIPDESIDLIFADPPYNLGKNFSNFNDHWPSDEAYAQWCYQWIDLCVSKLKASGSMYLMTSTQAMPYLDLYIRKKLTILSRIVWSYDSSGVQAKHYYGSLWEPILFGVKQVKHYTFNAQDILVEAKTGAKRKLMDYRGSEPKPYNTQKVPGNVWTIPRVRYRMQEYKPHPSQKPEKLMQRIIKASSNEGDLILDPFAGTFSTCAVAKKLNRKSIGIEFQEEYIKIGLKRLGITEKEAVWKNRNQHND